MAQTGQGSVAAPDLAIETQAAGAGNLLQWILLVGLIYVLICAVSIISSGFAIAAGDQARELFAFSENPFVGLMVGLAATALIQSSSSVTAIIVGLVGGGLPVVIAIPMIMGSNMGTTLTNTLVSLGHVREKQEFRRAFAAATVHDFFNILALLIFLPIELLFRPLERMSLAAAGWFYDTADADLSMSDVNFVGQLTRPVTGTVRDTATANLPEVAAGIVLIVIGIGLILLSIRYMSVLLKKLMVGRAKTVMHSAIGRGPLTGIASGGVVTVMVQSSSITTSLMVPLAGSGTLTLRQIYPFTLGANIGTTVTALLAATAVSGAMAIYALEIAFVHLFFNLLAVILIFSVPFLRVLPLWGAEWFAAVASERKALAAAYVLGVFIVVPLLLIFATAVL